MGMYDTIESEQVKCFYIPYFCADEIMGTGIYHSGGQLNYYGIGSKIPYKTKWYDYSKDFGIYSYWYYKRPSEDDKETLDYGPTFIVIRNGKVEKVIEGIENIKEKDVKGLNHIINSHGSFLTVKTVQDFFNLREDYYTYYDIYNQLTEETNRIMNEMMHYVHMSNGAKPIEEGLTKELIEEKIKECHKLYDKKDKEIEKDRKRLYETYLKPWFSEKEEIDPIVSDFGALLECLEKNRNYVITHTTTVPLEGFEQKMYQERKEGFYSMCGKIKEIKEKEPQVIETYKIWQSLNKKEIKDLDDLIDRIQKGKESI